jgi:hypothetical protein
MKVEPLLLPNVWRVFGLRESPYFQDTLGSTERSYPLSLFVGREQEASTLLTAIGSSSSSRQAVGGATGIGKTTLIQYVKARAIDAEYWAADELVPFFEHDTVERLTGRILASIYDTCLAARPMIGDHPAMRAAQQMVKVSRVQTSMSGGAGAMGFSASLSAGQTLVTPGESALLDGPRIIRDLLTLVRAESNGVVLHLNNLETLTEQAVGRAADLLRSLRDTVLMQKGLHVILVGTTESVTTATQTHAQLRSVVDTPIVLAPFDIAQVAELLAARYAYLRLPGATLVPPVAQSAVTALYPMFRGDLRGFLAALDEGVRLVGGATAHPNASVTLPDIAPALQLRYAGALRETMGDQRHMQLQRWAEAGPESEQTQKSLVALWGMAQGTVSVVLDELVRRGYVLERPRVGKRATPYVLSGVSRLVFG